MSLTFYTQTISSDGTGLALEDADHPLAPYIVYTCNNTVNLNFLFREVLFCDPEAIGVASNDANGAHKVHIVKSYVDDATAQAATATDRYADDASNSGVAIAMRIAGALMKSGLQATAINTEVTNAINYMGGYSSGNSGTSTNTSSSSTATMDFGEFFQVALSAIRNKETDAATSATNGLVDRENINNAAVADDLLARTVATPASSDLLASFLTSASKSDTYADGNDVTTTSDVNWMKQLVYNIIQNNSSGSGGVADAETGGERYIPIKRTGLTDNAQERFMQLKFQDGDAVVFVFKFTLTDGTNTFNIEQPDNAGTDMTIGFKVVHNDAAAGYSAAAADTGSGSTLPVGWEASSA